VSDDAKEPVPADGQGEQLPVLPAAAGVDPAGSVHQDEGLHVADNRWKPQSPPVDIRGQRATDADLIDPGLLLSDPPLRGLPRLLALQVRDQCGPRDAGLHRDVPLGPVEVQDTLKGGHIEQERVGAELLAAHRVASTCHAHGPTVTGRRPNEAVHMHPKPSAGGGPVHGVG